MPLHYTGSIPSFASLPGSADLVWTVEPPQAIADTAGVINPTFSSAVVSGTKHTYDALKKKIWFVKADGTTAITARKVGSDKVYSQDATVVMKTGGSPIEAGANAPSIFSLGNGWFSIALQVGGFSVHCRWNEGQGGQVNQQTVDFGGKAIIHAKWLNHRFLFMQIGGTTPNMIWRSYVCKFANDKKALTNLGFGVTQFTGVVREGADLTILPGGKVMFSMCSATDVKLYTTTNINAAVDIASTWTLVGTISGNFGAVCQCIDKTGRLVVLLFDRADLKWKVVVGQRQSNGSFLFPYSPVIVVNGGNEGYSNVFPLKDGTLSASLHATGHYFSRELRNDGLQGASGNGLWKQYFEL